MKTVYTGDIFPTCKFVARKKLSKKKMAEYPKVPTPATEETFVI